jgi:hypothetical protein
VPERKEQLADTSNETLEEIRELQALERTKRAEPISTTGFHELAERVTEKSRQIMRNVSRQEVLGNESRTGEESINDIDQRDRQDSA